MFCHSFSIILGEAGRRQQGGGSRGRKEKVLSAILLNVNHIGSDDDDVECYLFVIYANKIQLTVATLR